MIFYPQNATANERKDVGCTAIAASRWWPKVTVIELEGCDSVDQRRVDGMHGSALHGP